MDCQLPIADCQLGSKRSPVTAPFAVLSRRATAWCGLSQLHKSAIGNWQLAIGVTLLAMGCTAPRRTLTAPADPAVLDDAAFLHYLASVPTVTVGEGGRGVLLLLGPTTDWPSVEEQTAKLREAGALKDDWGLKPDDTLDKGTLSYMLTAILQTPPSVNEKLATITGLGDRRYALKNCIDLGLLPYGLPHEAVTGGELLTALRKAETMALRNPVR